MKSKALWINACFAWLVFVGIDFLFHASLLQALWKEPIAAIRPVKELALLIPAGYGSFFLLCLLIAYTFKKAYPEAPGKSETIAFACIWGLLFSISNFLGLYSYVAIPLKQLMAFNLVYLLEVVITVFVLRALFFNNRKSRVRWWCAAAFFGLILSGIVIQNVM